MKELIALLEESGITFSDLRAVEGSPDVIAVTVPGVSAIETWETLRNLVPQTGHWPVLTGGRTENGKWPSADWENIESSREQVEHTIANGVMIDPLEWFDQRRQEIEERLEEHESERTLEMELRNLRGKWPDSADAAGRTSFLVNLDISTRESLPEVEMLLVPAAHSWETPAYLSFGGWNECPEPEEHVAVLRYWHTRYGAEVVAITGDTIETMVARHPHSRQAAESLAWQQYGYAPDVVDQGTQTILSLAAILMASESWFFWWD